MHDIYKVTIYRYLQTLNECVKHASADRSQKLFTKEIKINEIFMRSEQQV